MSHYNLGLEKSIIATLFTVDGSLDHVINILEAEDFHAGRHQELYRIIKKLNSEGSPYDSVLVTEYLETNDLLKKVGGHDHLNSIMASEAGLFNFTHYAERIKNLSRHRALSSAIDKARVTASSNDSKVEDKINDIVNSLSKLEQTGDDVQRVFTVDSLVSGLIDRIASAKDGIKNHVETGFPELDNKMRASAGDLVIIAARPSMGKSLLVMNMQAHLSKFSEGASVFISLEMSEDKLMDRLAASEASIRLTAIKDGALSEDEYARLMQFASDRESMRLEIVRDTDATISRIRSDVIKAKKRHGKVSSIGVDYLQFMPGLDGHDKVDRIGEVTKALKKMAVEFECPVFLLSQLNRSVEQRPNKRPVNSDLRDSGNIEQDADQIIFIYREDYYKQKDGDKDLDGMADIIISKNRNGETGVVRLAFEGHMGRFSNSMPYHDSMNDIPSYGEQA